MVQRVNNFFLIAGEKSGDLYGSKLIEELLNINSKAIINYWGGDMMKEAGGNLLQHYRSYNFMGFYEVFKNLNLFLNKINLFKKHLNDIKPGVVILIDFPGLNLRFAKYCKIKGMKVIYLIPPKVWAWNTNRIYQIKKYVDVTFSILPFEVDFFKKYGLKIFYYGNPLYSIIDCYKFNKIPYKSNFENTISLLPGSRVAEVNNSIPIFKKIINSMPDNLFFVSCVDHFEKSIYDPLKYLKNVKLIFGRTYDMIKQSDVTVTVSGTASLEVALLNIPQMVVYKTSFLTYLIAKMVVKVKYISLVNLILNKPLIKEFIQKDFNSKTVKDEIIKILSDNDYNKKIKKGYKEISRLLNKKNVISKIALHIMKE